ncbi:hypothetical protein AVEN_273162-1 [Araneus ventricosus]|uniref:Uncharacterized protein n=1 Tax=Araneus ventricosus TaxID=182803 RepID=A0A4Y2K368_ARAVE|nr:hypothetical protein AVEN_273162-1 [Araneus ventricosus]
MGGVNGQLSSKDFAHTRFVHMANRCSVDLGIDLKAVRSWSQDFSTRPPQSIYKLEVGTQGEISNREISDNFWCPNAGPNGGHHKYVDEKPSDA